MHSQGVLDQTRVDQFVGKVLGDTSATLVTLLVAIGDRLGLFKELAASGPVTSADFASRTGIDERYAREWLGGPVGRSGAVKLTTRPWQQQDVHAMIRRRAAAAGIQTSRIGCQLADGTSRS